MRAKFMPPDAVRTLQQWIIILLRQPRLALLSYGCAALGALFAVHDFHHYNPNRFGFSTVFLGAAIVLYILSLGTRKPLKQTVPRFKR